MSADLRETIDRYNEAWNAHDLDAIVAMHAPGMVFENHTAGELAVGEAVRDHIAGDLRGLAGPALRDPAALRPGRPGRPGVDGDGHPREGAARGDIVAPPVRASASSGWAWT